MTAYLIKILDQDPNTVFIAYSLCSITAPIPGAATGGILADKNVTFCKINAEYRADTKERMF